LAFLDSVGVQNLPNSRRTIHAPLTKNKISKNPKKFKINGTGFQGVNCNSILEFSPSTKAHEFSQILIKMRIININNSKARFLLEKTLNNPNLSENYAKEILRQNRMHEKDFREKTINDLYNENLSKDDKIKKISRRCNREEITNVRKLYKIMRDNLLENLNSNEVINLLKKEKRLNIVLDNYRVHKTKLVENIAKILNINLIFLPPYSPDLNPIEDVWRKIKKNISNDNFKDAEELKKEFIKVFNEIINESSFYVEWLKLYIPTVANIR
jgi:transposase